MCLKKLGASAVARAQRRGSSFSAQPSKRTRVSGVPQSRGCERCPGGAATASPPLLEAAAQRGGSESALGMVTEPPRRGSLAHGLGQRSIINPGTGSVTFCWALSRIALVPHAEILPCFGSGAARRSRRGAACLCRRKVSATESKRGSAGLSRCLKTSLRAQSGTIEYQVT